LATAEHDVVFETVSKEELHAELDRLAHVELGMTADTFMAQWAKGDLDPFDPTYSRLGVLARLLSL
jgi:hypothetical protein